MCSRPFLLLICGWLLLSGGCQPVTPPPTSSLATPLLHTPPSTLQKAVDTPPPPTLSATSVSVTSTVFPSVVSSLNIYYVATDGNDLDGDGTVENPWATISWASSNVPDGSIILVQPGDYFEYVNLSSRFNEGVLIAAAIPYQARLRNKQKVVNCHVCSGITIEGFDIAHQGERAGRYVIQIQDAEGEGEGGRNITLRNNIIHDSYNNDLIKVNNGADQIIIEGNLFFNQEGSDSHIDVNGATNVFIQDNLFFNDFSGSGRINSNDTGSYIVVKDSLEGNQRKEGSQNIVIRRNLFFNWEGLDSNTFIVIGEDSVDYYQATNVLIENNLFLGNSANPIRAIFGVKGAQNIVFRNNTIVGDLPSKAYAMRLNLQENNSINRHIEFYNNIWSDPTGTMGANFEDTVNDFSDTAPQETESFVLLNNLYWNGGDAIPEDRAELINYTDDPAAIVADPKLPSQGNLLLPHWNMVTGQFIDNITTIREAFNYLVVNYGKLAPDSAAIDRANPNFAPLEDILGTPRQPDLPDIGAYEH